MPKFFDIAPAKKPPQVINKPIEPEKTKHRHAYYRRWYVLLLLVIIAVIVLLVQFKYESLEVLIGESQKAPQDQVKTVVDSTSLEKSLEDLFSQGENEVSIYQSGANKETIAKISQLLETEGFSVTDLGPSQRKYDKSYIWFDQSSVAAATKVEQILNAQGYKVEKRQSVSTNINLMVYLGDNK